MAASGPAFSTQQPSCLAGRASGRCTLRHTMGGGGGQVFVLKSRRQNTDTEMTESRRGAAEHPVCLPSRAHTELAAPGAWPPHIKKCSLRLTPLEGAEILKCCRQTRCIAQAFRVETAAAACPWTKKRWTDKAAGGEAVRGHGMWETVPPSGLAELVQASQGSSERGKGMELCARSRATAAPAQRTQSRRKGYWRKQFIVKVSRMPDRH